MSSFQCQLLQHENSSVKMDSSIYTILFFCFICACQCRQESYWTKRYHRLRPRAAPLMKSGFRAHRDRGYEDRELSAFTPPSSDIRYQKRYQNQRISKTASSRRVESRKYRVKGFGERERYTTPPPESVEFQDLRKKYRFGSHPTASLPRKSGFRHYRTKKYEDQELLTTPSPTSEELDTSIYGYDDHTTPPDDFDTYRHQYRDLSIVTALKSDEFDPREIEYNYEQEPISPMKSEFRSYWPKKYEDITNDGDEDDDDGFVTPASTLPKLNKRKLNDQDEERKFSQIKKELQFELETLWDVMVEELPVCTRDMLEAYDRAIVALHQGRASSDPYLSRSNKKEVFRLDQRTPPFCIIQNSVFRDIMDLKQNEDKIEKKYIKRKRKWK
ncbi:unnamed protein product [Nezara viridula]|uniref:Uncharacterized protein n=1 Tax=Nezara viridula TaxID=85310 RepID=A0A9P0H8U8_NEZVI|nr:unnamed protein product [Nezara viridula]